MNAERKPLDGFAVSVMLALCLCWGMQQVALKVAAPVIEPVMQTAIRSTLAAIMVAAVMLARGIPILNADRTLMPGIMAGLMFSAEFLFVALGLGYTTASHMSVFLYTAPIFTALGLHFWVPGEKLTPLQWLGVAIAFCGVATAFSSGILYGGVLPGMWIGDSLGILAGAFWGGTTVLIRSTTLSETPPSKTLLYQLTMAGLVLLLFSWATGADAIGTMTPIIWTSMIFQTVLVCFASFLIWFWMLRRYLAARLSVFTFLTPVFGMAFGVWLLDDPFDPAFGIGAVLILAGIALVNMPRRG